MDTKQMQDIPSFQDMNVKKMNSNEDLCMSINWDSVVQDTVTGLAIEIPFSDTIPLSLARIVARLSKSGDYINLTVYDASKEDITPVFKIRLDYRSTERRTNSGRGMITDNITGVSISYHKAFQQNNVKPYQPSDMGY